MTSPTLKRGQRVLLRAGHPPLHPPIPPDCTKGTILSRAGPNLYRVRLEWYPRKYLRGWWETGDYLSVVHRVITLESRWLELLEVPLVDPDAPAAQPRPRREQF